MAPKLSAVHRLRQEIEQSGRPDGELLARLLLQSVLEAEVTEFLGRDRGQRSTAGSGGRSGIRAGYRPVEVASDRGPVPLEMPKVRGGLAPFESRLVDGAEPLDLSAVDRLCAVALERDITPEEIKSALDHARPAAEGFTLAVCEKAAAEFGSWAKPERRSRGRDLLTRLEGPTAAARQGPNAAFGFHWRDDKRHRSHVGLAARSVAVVVPLAALLTGIGTVLGVSAAKIFSVPKTRAEQITRVTVPEGLRLDETLALLARRTGIAQRQFQQALTGGLDLPEYAGGDAEGLLFPATYEVRPGQSASSILRAMVTRFREAAAEVGLPERGDPAQTLTVASLAQAEGGNETDYPKIARVIYNRLAKHTPLQLDTTVLYAQHRRSLRVSDADTRVASPYNTYRRQGLPPGPIDSPGEAALRAALHPADGDWRWFVTTDPKNKVTKFTDDPRRFAEFRKELHQNLRNNE